MKTILKIFLGILILLGASGSYFLYEYTDIHEDPMGDGQSGIGAGIIGLLTLGTAILAAFIGLLVLVLVLFNKAARIRLAYINILLALLIFSILTILLFY